MDYQQLIDKINAEITTNGANEITGAKLNEVLRDIVDTVAESVIPVQVILSDNEKKCLFRWPYDLKTWFSTVTTEACRHLQDSRWMARVSWMQTAGVWGGNLQKLEKGRWYAIGYQGITSNTNCIIYLGRQQSN